MIENASSKDTISKSDVYRRLWRGRDFEIKHLWQRSIFLGTFLVLIFTAYIGLWSVVIGQMQSDDTTIFPANYIRQNVLVFKASVVTKSEYLSRGPFLIIYELTKVFIVLSCLGSAFSLLWIFMAKGSKYWYEKYETSLSTMQDDYELFDAEINQEWYKEKILAKLEYRAEKQIPIHGYLRKSDANSSFVFSLLGGPYSVSKINVLIGIVFFSFWIFAQALHWSVMIPMESLLFRLIISFLMSMIVNSFLLLLLGNLSKSGESDWITRFKPLQVEFGTRTKGINRKKRECEWISAKLRTKEYKKFGYLFKSINRKGKGTKESRKSRRHLNRDVKKLIDKEHTAQLFNYLEENVIAYEFPKAMQGKWGSGDRSIEFEPITGEQTKNEWEAQILAAMEQIPSSRLKRDIYTRVFSDIPWGEIAKVNKCNISTENYESWRTTLILCDGRDKDKAICYESFWLDKRQNIDNEYSLKSTLRWVECKSEQMFSWTKTK